MRSSFFGRGARLGFCAGSLLLLSGAADQTGEIALVAQFLAKTRAADLEAASSLLAPGATVADSATPAARTLEQFADYAAACPLRKIHSPVVHSLPPGRPFPVGAVWSCKYPEAERQASFWIEDGRIARLSFGTPMVIEVPPVRRP
jgi:hypothetical protein